MAWHARQKEAPRRLRAPLLTLVRGARTAGQTVHRVAEQGLTRARMAGAQLARHIVSVQKAAGLEPHLIEASARSVQAREMTRPSDRQWQQGYGAAAARLIAPPQPRRQPQPAADREAGA